MLGAIDLQVDWRQAAAAVLVLLAVLTASPAAVRLAVQKGRSLLARVLAGTGAGSVPNVSPDPQPEPETGGRWPADAGAPSGAIEYATAINEACGKMPAEFFRQQILQGSTTHQTALARAAFYESRQSDPRPE